MTSIFGFEEAYTQSMFRIKEDSDNFWKKPSTDSSEISRWKHLTHTLGGTAAILPAAFLATTENVIKLPLILTTTILLEIPLATLGHLFNVVRCPSAGKFFLEAQKDVPGMRAFMLCAFKIVRLTIGMLFTATVGLCLSTQINHWVHIKLHLIKPAAPPQPKEPGVEVHQNNHTELEEALEQALTEKKNLYESREELLQLAQEQKASIKGLEFKIAKILKKNHALHNELRRVKAQAFETEMKLQEKEMKSQECEKQQILLNIAAFIKQSRAQKESESSIDCSAINQRIDERAAELKRIERSLDEMDDFEGEISQ